MDNKIKNMSSGKALKIYLDTVNARLRYLSGGLVSIEYNNKNDCDIFDSYGDLITFIRRMTK